MMQSSSSLNPTAEAEHYDPNQQFPLRPTRVSEWWTIAMPPDLRPFALEPTIGLPGRGRNEPNDHTIFRAEDGWWHLWACVRHTAVGRILCHWRSPSLEKADWEFCSDILRCDHSSGESMVAWENQEFIQSPFVVRHQHHYYMFYGGYDTGFSLYGYPSDDYNLQEKQLCLMTSSDGLQWQRHRNAEGFSRVFVGPGAVRDPMIGYFNGLWHCYYAGHHNGDRYCAGIYHRTSRDLITWSDWSVANHDNLTLPMHRRIIHESPFVCYRNGHYYLFRNPGRFPGTQVFISDRPDDFGPDAGSCALHFLTHLPDVIAPEIVVDEEGREYISRINHPEGYRIQLARLEWQPLS